MQHHVRHGNALTAAVLFFFAVFDKVALVFFFWSLHVGPNSESHATFIHAFVRGGGLRAGVHGCVYVRFMFVCGRVCACMHGTSVYVRACACMCVHMLVCVSICAFMSVHINACACM